MDGDDPGVGRSLTATLERGRLSALDGLRAFAVLVVMAFHAGIPGTGGGLLGVDIFFVLSGFLITSILCAEFERRRSVALGHFWAQRARRLLPALFIVILGVAAYAHFYADSVDLGGIRADALATLAYVANWHYIFSAQGYFARGAAPSPLLHTWSLGVEEQYYLIWPLIALATLRRFGRRGLAWVAGVGALLSAAEMAGLHGAGASIDRLYYGTDTRAQALLVGSFLGAVSVPGHWRVLPQRMVDSVVGRWVVPGAGLLGAIYLVWACHVLNGQEAFLYQGGFLLVALATAAVVVFVVTWPDRWLARALSLAPLTFIGRISYGLYLYHWPLFLALDEAHTGLAPVPLAVVRFTATFAAATASFFLVEEPIRTGTLLRHWRALGVAGLTAGVTAGIVVAATVTPVVAGAATAAPALPTAERAQLASMHAFTSHPLRFVLFGDSIAVTLAHGLRFDATARYGVRLYDDAKLGCDLDPTLEVHLGDGTGPATPGCPGWRRTWLAEVDRVRPQVVGILLGRWEVADHLYQGHWTHIGQPRWDDHLTAELTQAIRIVSSTGARVVLFTMPYVDPPVQGADGSTFSEDDPSRCAAYNALVRRLAAAHPGLVTLIDLNTLLCPHHHFTWTVDGIVVRWSDGIHITTAAGRWLQPSVMPTLTRLGLASASAPPSIH